MSGECYGELKTPKRGIKIRPYDPYPFFIMAEINK